MDFKYYLAEHFKKHPSIMPRDVVKACYQAAYGAEHLLADMSGARRYFDAEFEAVAHGNSDLFEMLSDSVARVDLGAWKKAGLPKEWLFNMFASSAGKKKDGNLLFEEYLALSEDVIGQNGGFSLEEWRDFLKEYRARGGGAVHHSDSYRQGERPAYRIVDSEFLKLLPLLSAMNNIDRDGVKVISVDGRAASGKSWLAERLRAATGAEIIHMDDFFLPPALRTSDRLATAGGNIHYERFIEEILPNIGGRESFSYGVFDCGKMEITGECRVGESLWRIVEGSYSQHPEFGDYADLYVFCTVDPNEQMRRIISRNGEKMAVLFKDRWIPMEEHYFEVCGIKEKADLILSL